MNMAADGTLPRRAIGAIVTFARTPLTAIGLILILVMFALAIAAPLIAPYDPLALNPAQRLQPPSLDHLLGTDQLGRDLFSRVLYGGRVALRIALICIGVAFLIGVPLGLLSGYGPRWLENALLFLFDAVRSFPIVILALVLITVTGPSLATILIVVVIAKIPDYARVVRAQTQSVRNATFIRSAQAMGLPFWRVLFVHLAPNVIGPVFILASMDIPVVITIEAGLSFLGLGVRPPTPSWGTILNDGFSFIQVTPWPIIAGCLPLVIVTLGFTFLGEALRDALDPKTRRL
ncbi:MAG: ABC transporter permease [Parvibaculaceae bacterium]